MKKKARLYCFLLILILHSTSVFSQNTFPTSGNVGIGTNSPLAKLHVANGELLLQNTEGTAAYPILWLKNITGDRRLRFDYNSMLAEGDHMYIGSRNGYNIIINNESAGNVGIGTASPFAKLQADLIGTNSGYVGGFTTDQNGIFIGSTSSNPSDILLRVNYGLTGRQNGSGGNTAFSVQGNGNVGIGTASPGYKLTVAGDAYTSGQLITEMNSPEGGAVTLINNSKTGQGANCWKLYNMTGTYGDALCFWKYHANGTNGGPQLQLFDNGTSHFNGDLTLSGNQVNYGNMSIGTTASQKNLSVNGNITTRKIKVTQIGWPDYVFDSSYQLPSLSHVETFIKENKHLPEVPSAAEVKKEGLDLGENQAILLKKIEELTLYIIGQNKQISQQNKKIESMEKQIAALQANHPGTDNH
ncbi:TMF family protein [Filimonas effusa]|uniref:BZIP transcription factor n=1 Tax=Filimonas effusa TaxID=2508721 RepID=A0A4Q1D4Z8_9BACT|nr:TMF family protein [Filimonas effusa]RXK82903.1 hypothetical protein ESB13_12300 [Filimonas effusa]